MVAGSSEVLYRPVQAQRMVERTHEIGAEPYTKKAPKSEPFTAMPQA
jgi:hypothetical protein